MNRCNLGVRNEATSQSDRHSDAGVDPGRLNAGMLREHQVKK
jgi:hypothetical protein